MSNQNPNGSHVRPVYANLGLRLMLQENGLMAALKAPDGHIDDRFFPTAFPPVPGRLLEETGGWLRAVWRSHEKCGLWLLYLNPPKAQWRAYLPPQMADARDVRYNASFPGVEPPTPDLRLAGSFLTCPFDDHDEIIPRLPPFDGLHFTTNFQYGWLYVRTFLVIDGEAQAVRAGDWIQDDPARSVGNGLADRVWTVEQLDRL